MKKSIFALTLSLLLICLIHNPGSAQVGEHGSSSRFGVKGGVNFSNMYNQDQSTAKMLTGFNLGLFGKFPVTSFLAIQPEFLFTTKGAEVTYDNLFVNGTAHYRLNYLEFPLLLVINVTRHFNIHFGPYASFLVSGVVRNVSTADLFNFEQNINTSDYNRFDAGITAGAGIDLGALSLGARFDYGLINIGKERTFLGTTYTVPNAFNGALSVYASISLY